MPPPPALLLLLLLLLAPALPSAHPRPHTLRQTVSAHLSSGGHAALRAAFALPPGVLYDPLRFLTREDIAPRPGPPSAPSAPPRRSSDLALLRALRLHVPGLDPLPSATHPVRALRNDPNDCSTDVPTIVPGEACRISVSFSPDTPSHIKPPVIFSIRQWANQFRSEVALRICFIWDDSLEALTLGATSTPFFTDGASWPSLNDDAFYSPALASAIERQDVIDPSKFHVHMVLNRKIPWHLDTNRPAPPKEYDLATTVLHELTHGLFFAGSITTSTDDRIAEFEGGKPGRLDMFMKVAGNVAVAKSCRNRDLFNAITNSSLGFFDDRSGASFGLYSPGTFVTGSSTYHFDNVTLTDDCNRNGISRDLCSDLMTHQLEDGYTQRAIGETTLRVLRAMNSTARGVNSDDECNLVDSRPSDAIAQDAGTAVDFVLPKWGIATVAVVAGVGSILVFGVVVSTVVSRRDGQ